MQKQSKSFFEQETALAEIELPTELRHQFIQWTKKLEKQDKYKEKLKATLEMKNNEYFLILEDEKDEKQTIRMNISDLKQPMNKCNFLIPSPPYNEPRDIQNINFLPYKAKAKIENNYKDLEDLQTKFSHLYHSDNQNSSRSEIELTESESEFQLPDPFSLSHLDIKDQPARERPQVEVDKRALKISLIEFLRSKGDNGASLQDIKQYYKFQNIPDKHLIDVLKKISNTTKKASKIIYFLPSTLQN